MAAPTKPEYSPPNVTHPHLRVFDDSQQEETSILRTWRISYDRTIQTYSTRCNVFSVEDECGTQIPVNNATDTIATTDVNSESNNETSGSSNTVIQNIGSKPTSANSHNSDNTGHVPSNQGVDNASIIRNFIRQPSEGLASTIKNYLLGQIVRSPPMESNSTPTLGIGRRTPQVSDSQIEEMGRSVDVYNHTLGCAFHNRSSNPNTEQTSARNNASENVRAESNNAEHHNGNAINRDRRNNHRGTVNDNSNDYCHSGGNANTYSSSTEPSRETQSNSNSSSGNTSTASNNVTVNSESCARNMESSTTTTSTSRSTDVQGISNHELHHQLCVFHEDYDTSNNADCLYDDEGNLITSEMIFPDLTPTIRLTEEQLGRVSDDAGYYVSVSYQTCFRFTADVMRQEDDDLWGLSEDIERFLHNMQLEIEHGPTRMYKFLRERGHHPQAIYCEMRCGCQYRKTVKSMMRLAVEVGLGALYDIHTRYEGEFGDTSVFETAFSRLRECNCRRQATITELPLATLEGTGTQQQTCCICLVDMKDGDTHRVIRCKHLMHKACLDRWLENRAGCPMCRKVIVG